MEAEAPLAADDRAAQCPDKTRYAESTASGEHDDPQTKQMLINYHPGQGQMMSVRFGIVSKPKSGELTKCFTTEKLVEIGECQIQRKCDPVCLDIWRRFLFGRMLINGRTGSPLRGCAAHQCAKREFLGSCGPANADVVQRFGQAKKS